MNWPRLQAAVELVQQGNAKRVDCPQNTYKVYQVSDGTTRIDIPPKKEEATRE